MKKIFYLSYALCLAFMLLLVCSCGNTQKDDNKENIKHEDKNYYFSFGVFGDTQLGADDSPQNYSVNSAQAIKITMEYFKDSGVDAILNVGDVIDYCEFNSLRETAYDKYNEILDGVFGERDENGIRGAAPIMLQVMGNHEYSAYTHNGTDSWYWDYPAESAIGMFCRQLNTELVQVYENYGYTIITANMTDCRGGFTDEVKQEIENALRIAAQDDPWRPIFMATHYIPKDTLIDSWEWNDSEWLNELLKKYPQTVLFTGHTHNPLNDPRNISQINYTVVNAGCNEYACLLSSSAGGLAYENVLYNTETAEEDLNSFHEDWNKVHHALLVDVYGNKTVIRKINVASGKEMGEPFIIYKYNSKEDFDYQQKWNTETQSFTFSESLLALSVGPKFSEETKESATAVYNDGVLTVKFHEAFVEHMSNDRITLSNIVECYQIKVFSTSDALLADKTYVGRYWLNHQLDTLYKKIIHISEKPSRVEIIPYDAYAKKGESLHIDVA